MRTQFLVSAAGLLLAAASIATAEEAFYYVTAADLTITDGELPKSPEGWASSNDARAADFEPYAVLDGPGEVYLTDPGWSKWWAFGGGIAIRRDQPGDVTGRVFTRKTDLSGLVARRFEIPEAARNNEAREHFYRAKHEHYRRLAERGVPGAAWFRYQATLARRELPGAERLVASPPSPRDENLDPTFALFSGSRAVSENLRLDRPLTAAGTGEERILVSKLRGIEIAPIDWRPLINGKQPALDPLSASIPDDQHVVFFRSFAALAALADEADRWGTPVLSMFGNRPEDEQVQRRYERQLCVSLSGLARLVGPQLVESVALTGSDPYVAAGTDVALLFETRQPAVLRASLLSQAALLAQKAGAGDAVQGEVSGVAYQGFRTADRRVSCYVATLGEVVAVTNSPAQLSRLIDVARGRVAAVKSLPEYVFFRDRYRRGDEQETALVFLSDATIRRWCGPRCRIADSRRTRDRALLAELQAAHFDELVGGTVEEQRIRLEHMPVRLGELRLTPHGVVSSTGGTLDFQTPIIEMPLDRVTWAESNAYERWRDNYQRIWRGTFDPIALRLGVTPKALTADLTVMPLIAASQYHWQMELARGAKLTADSGDPHPAGLQLVHALKLNDLLRLAAPAHDPLRGFGNNLSLSFEDDPLWQKLAETLSAKEAQEFLNRHGRLPVALYVDIADAKQAAAELPNFKWLVEAMIGETTRDELNHRGRTYVALRPKTDKGGSFWRGQPVPLYYALADDGLLLTFHEGVLKRYIERQVERREAEAAGRQPPPPWLGEAMALRVDGRFLSTAGKLGLHAYRDQLQRRSWNNLPILNEWRRRYPDSDPQELYQRFWAARLVCPGGGEYVWNDQWKTMESTVFGHPGQPKSGPDALPLIDQIVSGNFGVTFEHQGLRARAVLERHAP
ncbi:MAG TPA: hypothetical protein VJ783_21580 [Pirellulales bacterium]|nr:hypothetical protein [Pirellulales bacterium]